MRDIKKTIKKVLALSLAVMSVFYVACTKKENKDEGNFLMPPAEEKLENTLHQTVIGETSYNLVQDGKTEYKIIVSDSQRSLLAEAINEFITLFEEATGIMLSTMSDTDVTYQENSKYISLGSTNVLNESGITVDYSQLGSQGYQIETKGQSIFICGNPKGVLYGVYDVLYYLFDFETFSNKVYYIQKNVKNVSLPLFRIKEVPDIEYRIPVTGTLRFNRTAAHRMRMFDTDEIFMKGGGVHNILADIVPYSDALANEHPSWFSGDRTQLCYTAHGNETEYELLLATAVESVKRIIVDNPYHDVMSITQMDVQTWCECTTCQASEDTYGTNAAVQINFINDLTDIVNEWLEVEQNSRDVQFLFFAYHLSEIAPATKNEDGVWQSLDEQFQLNDNVAIWIAPIYEDYTRSVYDSESINMRNMFESWNTCADTYFVWTYGVYFDNYLIPLDSYSVMQDMVQYLVKYNTKFLWSQGNYNTNQNTGYDDLKAYLFSKLMWDCNSDINALISHFFKRVYREAGPIMEESFWAWRALSEEQKELGKVGTCFNSPWNKKFWTKRYLVGQLDRMEEAKKAIEIYKTSDPALYQAIYDSIVCETISPRFLLLDLFSSTFTKSELVEMKKSFQEDTNRLEFNRLAEAVVLDGYFN